MMYTMPKNLLSICVNFTLATQQAVSAKLHKYTAEFTASEHKSPKSLLRKARKRGKIYSGNTADMAIRNRQSYKGG